MNLCGVISHLREIDEDVVEGLGDAHRVAYRQAGPSSTQLQISKSPRTYSAYQIKLQILKSLYWNWNPIGYDITMTFMPLVSFSTVSYYCSIR